MVTVDSRILDFWVAFDSIEPMGETWMQTATIAKSIEVNTSFTAASKGNRFTTMPLKGHMPPRWSAPPEEKKPKRKGRSAKSFRKALEKRHG